MIWLLGGSYVAALVSALLPWVNGELLMLAAMPAATKLGAVPPVVVAFTLGQMTGKSAMYWVTRTAVRRPSARLAAAGERWRTRFEQHPRWTLVVVFVSGVVGLPPFYAVSIAAGTLRMPFTRFVAAGGAGRLAHFAMLACVPEALGLL